MHGRIGNWQKPKVDIVSLEGFIGWLEKQPPEEQYSWGNCSTCAIAQYLGAHGIRIRDISYEKYNALEGGAGNYVALGRPHTFGAALDRARAIQDPK